MTPRCSIVVPTYQRPVALAACLESLAAQDYPRDRYEVIVVNDGGASVQDVVTPFATRVDVRVIEQPNAGPGAARNRGAHAAAGKMLAFTDDDCRADPSWLAALAARLTAEPDCVVGGRVTSTLDGPRHLCSGASQMLVSYLYAYYNRDGETARFFTSNNLAVRREAFVNIGGFDASYRGPAAEDREFCDRWVTGGGRMVYAADAVIRHAHPLTLPAFWRQHFRYGRGALHFRQARAARNAGSVRLEPARFYSDLLAYPWRCAHAQPFRMAMLLAIAQAANALGFFWEKALGPGVPRAMKIPGNVAS